MENLHYSRLSPFLFLLLLLSTQTQTQTQQQQDTPITRFQRYLQINTAHPKPDYSSAISFLKTQAEALNLQVQTLHFTPNKDKPILLLTWLGSNPSLPSLLFNSHLDSVPVEPSKWSQPSFSAVRSSNSHIYACGAQDDKCIAIQYLEAIRNLKAKHFSPIRTIHVSYVPNEEIGGSDGAAKFVRSKEFEDLNVGFALDKGQASLGDEFRVFDADRMPWNVLNTQWRWRYSPFPDPDPQKLQRNSLPSNRASQRRIGYRGWGFDFLRGC